MRVLLAEDDPVFRLLLQRVLRKWGYEPELVDDGEQAWQRLTSNHGPKLAILDWMMPGVDGLEVCRRVRAGNLPHYVYIVLLTGKTEADNLLAGLEAGVDDYLTKPVNLNQLNLRLRAAVRVLEAEEKHRMIAEVSSDGIVTMDAEHTIGFANSAAGAIFGCDSNKLLGRNFSDFAPNFDSRMSKANTESEKPKPSAGSARSWKPIELTGRHVTGRDVSLEISFADSVNVAHKRIVTAMIRDTTDRRARDIQHAHAQKLESIGQMAAGVAHEINTPIQYIGDNLRFIEESFTGITKLLEAHQCAWRDFEKTADVPSKLAGLEALAASVDLTYIVAETPGAITQALEGVGRVAEIVRAMKEFSHPGTETAPLDLNHLIETTALVSRNRWKFVADLETDFDVNLPPVTGMSGELGQVFLNLFVNGADAIGDAIKGNPGQKGTLRVSTRLDGDYAEVRVRDTGTGIPPEVGPKIFDPFFTTKAVGSGTGQGLSLAYAIVVQKHRGTISFETQMGAGTTLIVRLPVAGPEGAAPLSQNQLGSDIETNIGQWALAGVPNEE